MVMVEDRVKNLELDVENIKTRLDFKTDDINEHDNEIANIRADIQNLSTKLDIFIEKTDLRIQMLENVNNKCQDVEKKYADIDKKIDVLEGKIQEKNRIIAVLVIPAIISFIDILINFLG